MLAIDDHEELVPLSELRSQPQYAQAPATRVSLPIKGEHVTPQTNPRDTRWIRKLLKTLHIVGPVTMVRKLAFYWLLQADEFLWTVRGPRVSKDALAARMDICRACSQRDGQYCKACGCAHWPPARLKNKNRFARWNCPHGKHPGSFIDAKMKPTNKSKGGCNGND